MKKNLFLCGIFIGGLLPATVMAESISSVDKYAWGENSGWFNFKPGGSYQVNVYDDHLEGYFWSEKAGWIRLGTHTGGGTHTYSNTNQNNYGVNHDGSGNLSGYAWSENVGWINFNPTTNHQVNINSNSGDFSGYAWSEKVGWIRFQSDISPTYKVSTQQTTTRSLGNSSIKSVTIAQSDESSAGAGLGVKNLTLTDASSCSYLEDVLKAYIAHYNRPAEIQELNFWACKIEALNGDLTSILSAFSNSEEFKQRYGGLNDDEIIGLFYQQLFQRDPDDSGKSYWINALANGAISYEHIAMALINGALGEDKTVVQNKLLVAEYFIQQFDGNNSNISDYLEVLNRVTAEPESVIEAKAMIDRIAR